MKKMKNTEALTAQLNELLQQEEALKQQRKAARKAVRAYAKLEEALKEQQKATRKVKRATQRALEACAEVEGVSTSTAPVEEDGRFIAPVVFNDYVDELALTDEELIGIDACIADGEAIGAFAPVRKTTGEVKRTFIRFLHSNLNENDKMEFFHPTKPLSERIRAQIHTLCEEFGFIKPIRRKH